MQKRLEAYLVLGCNGFKGSDGFIQCHGVENPIIDLSIITQENYESLLEFFDNACDLFSRPMNSHNKCVNTLGILYRKYKVYDEAMLHNIQSFIKTHKKCGVWLMLVMKEDLNG